jgi:hypothetical protein
MVILPCSENGEIVVLTERKYRLFIEIIFLGDQLVVKRLLGIKWFD